jgi:hypothetical protein
LDIAPKQAKPPKPRAARVSKRAVEEVLGEERGGNEEKNQTKRRRTLASDIRVAGMIPPTPVAPVHPRPTMRSALPSLPLPSTPFRPPAQHPQQQLIYQSPFPHNSYTVLATPPVQFYQNPQSPYTPIPYPYPYYYPPNTPSSSSQQSFNMNYNPYQYPHHTPGPPPPGT